MDIVYPVKKTTQNLELRYSLRSLINLPHDQVFIAGDCPSWVANVKRITVQQIGRKAENSLRNILAACARPDLSDDFILMNDDFFIMRPQTGITEHHLGDLETFLETFPHRGYYWQLAESTNRMLKEAGVSDRYFYGIHIPTVLNKHKVLELVKRFEGEPIMLRTLYHNIYGTGGTYRKDVKQRVESERIRDLDYLSTSDQVAHGNVFRASMQGRFPTPCYYEGY